MFKFFIFFPFLLLSSEFFILPDDNMHLNNNIEISIKKAKKHIYIFTKNINNYTLNKSLTSTAKTGIKIDLITSPKNLKDKASYLSIFNNINVYTLNTNTDIKGSLICIDKDNFFFLSQTLDAKELNTNVSFAIHIKQNCKKRFEILLKRSNKY